MLTAYFDESGSPDDSVAVVVAGYISTVDQWIRFDMDWKQILARYGIKCFHMKDFVHSRGEFESWKGKEEQRKWFLQSLIGITRVRVLHSFAESVLIHEWEQVNKKYMLAESWLTPYALCGRSCTASVNKWMNQSPRKAQPVHFVFDDGAKHKGELIKRMERDGCPLPTFGKREDYSPLQAADLVAWEHLKAHTLVERNALKKLRQSLEALTQVSNSWGIHRVEHLEYLCKEGGIPLRSSFPTPCPAG